MPPVTIDGTNGITTPMYSGAISANAVTPVNSFKNRIINGNMSVDQRNAGAAVTSSGSFPVDRFSIAFSTDGAFSAQQDSSAPTGFTNSVKCTTTTADASLSASQYWFFRQRIEGYNVADLGFGTASAKTVTLSFWVRSSLTGTFSGSLLNGDTNRSYPFNYTILVADTWEQKSVTIAGDTAGTWLKTNGNGMVVGWSLGIGSNYQGTANTWAGTEYYGTAGSVSVIGTLNATWYITGVQLEVGSTATSFDYRPYGTELSLCQRYFVKDLQDASSATFLIGVVDTTTSADRCGMRFPVSMRTAPTAAVGGTANPRIYDGSGVPTITSIGSNTSSSFGASLRLVGSGGGLTVGRAAIIIDNNASFFTYSAEL